jgi:hypothetical protein
MVFVRSGVFLILAVKSLGGHHLRDLNDLFDNYKP